MDLPSIVFTIPECAGEEVELQIRRKESSTTLPSILEQEQAKGISMSLVLELPDELETELAGEAARLGLPLAEYVLRLLAGRPVPPAVPRSGAELLAYWQGEGLVGTRPDISDASAHARAVRDQAQRRARP